MAARSAPLTVSVVVPTRNRADGLARAVGAVLADPSTTEVVVVDDGSTDETAAVLDGLARRDPRVRSVPGGGRGAAAARQLGLEAATGDIVLMLDDDVVAGPELVTGHRDVHGGNGDTPVVVVGHMPTARPSVRRRGQFATLLYAAEYDAHVDAWERGTSSVLRSLWSGNVSARRSTWLAVGVHDPDYPAVNHNDRDLGLRMEQLGVPAVFDRSLTATHAHRRTMDQFLADAHRQGAGRVLLHQRHGDRAAFDIGSLTDDLPYLARRLVLSTDRPGVRWAAEAALRAIVSGAGLVHLWALEDAGAKLLRRIALRAGAIDATTAGPTSGRGRSLVRRTATHLVRAGYRAGHAVFARNSVKQLPLVRKLTVPLVRALRDDHAEVLGHHMWLDPNDSLRLSIVGVFEPFETSLFEHAIQPDDVVVDVGANIGYYTLLAARAVGRGGHVYAFEPDPDNFALLSRNVVDNGYADRVTLVAAAAGAAPGEAMLYRSRDNHGDHRLFAVPDRDALPVDVVRVDDVVAGPVDVVKVDVQGFEPAVLAGMQGVLDASPDVVLFTELSLHALDAAGFVPGDYLAALVESGFEIATIDEAARRLGPLAADAPLSNLLCTRPKPVASPSHR